MRGGTVGSCSAWHPRPSRHLLPRAFPFQRENGARNANGRRKKQASKEAKKGEQAKRKEGSKATVFLGDHLSFFSFLRPPSFRTYGIIGLWGSFVRLFFYFRGAATYSHTLGERERRREKETNPLAFAPFSSSPRFSKLLFPNSCLQPAGSPLLLSPQPEMRLPAARIESRGVEREKWWGPSFPPSPPSKPDSLPTSSFCPHERNPGTVGWKEGGCQDTTVRPPFVLPNSNVRKAAIEIVSPAAVAVHIFLSSR